MGARGATTEARDSRTTSRERRPRRLPAGARRSFDVVAIAALGVTAYLARRGSLPVDGLWFDDSWVAAGAIYGHFTALMTVGSGTPGFTAVLMAVHRLGSGGLDQLGMPSLVAGIAGPSVLYVALRTFGYERAIAALVSAALVVARIPILYSGRVKGYTFDLVWVIVLATALPFLAARTWRFGLAVMWVVGAVAIATFSGYTMVAVAGAGIILVLHVASDRIFRVGAVAAQGIVQLLFLVVSEKKSDLPGIEKVLENTYDAHMNFTWNPIAFGREALTHLRRVAEVYPAGSGAWLTIMGVLAITGLVAAAVRGRRSESVAARYLLLLVVIAFVGSLLHRFPFGTLNFPVSPGGRHTLWLVPAVALGLAAVAHRLRAVVTRTDALRFGFDALAVTGAVLLVTVAYTPAPAAPFPGSQSGTSFVEASIRSGDVVIITSTSTYSFAVSASTAVRLVATPRHQVGFAPLYEDPRIHVVGPWAVDSAGTAQIRSWAKGAKRVFVNASGSLGGPALAAVGRVLAPLGFTMEERVVFGWNTIQVWRHAA